MECREYQTQAVNAIIGEWETGIQKTLLVMPTGTGKTIVIAMICKELVKRGERVLILAHREELLQQAADKIYKATGLLCSVEKAEETSLGSFFRITVGSVQSLTQEKRLKKFAQNHFSTIIIDEAHHSVSDSYTRILDYFSSAKVLGVTATPDRGDRKNLGQLYESMAYNYTLPKAIKDGFLCKIKALTLPLDLDLSKVSISAGDFKASDLDTALDPYLYQIADEMIEHCTDRKTVVFLPLIKTSQKFCGILQEKGFKAAEVNGMSDDRKEILEAFDTGKYNVLCNSMLLTEGWDCPSVDCIIMLRPTKIRSLYAQAIGRGTRLYPGKDHLLILDFLWHTERHDLCHPASLICTSPEVEAKMTENLELIDLPIDIELAEEIASADVLRAREEALATQLEEMKKRKRALVDPIQYAMSIQAEDLASYVPLYPKDMLPPTQKQLDTLEQYGIYGDTIDNAGMASLIIEKLINRRSEGYSTPKQIRLLERYGFKHVGEWEFDSANALIKRIAASGWSVPKDIDPATYVPVKSEVYDFA